MNRYFLILKLFFKAKFIFKNPPKYQLVIFDDESFINLKNFIHNYNYFILQSRIKNINKIYISLKIIKYFFKNYNGNIMTAYLVSLLEIINPKVVLTNIDNSFKFFDLARAIISKAQILILDEPTSGLDVESERLFNESISMIRKDKKVTIIIVTHNLKNITNTDNIIVLKDGLVSEQGKHEELIVNGGWYASAWKKGA